MNKHIILILIILLLLIYNNNNCIEYFTISNQNCSGSQLYNSILNDLINNKIQEEYHDYGRKFKINGQSYYNTKRYNDNPHVCEDALLVPGERIYKICNKGEYFCKENNVFVNDDCVSRQQLLNAIESNISNGSI
jgi:hypothetical protein